MLIAQPVWLLVDIRNTFSFLLPDFVLIVVVVGICWDDPQVYIIIITAVQARQIHNHRREEYVSICVIIITSVADRGRALYKVY